MADCKFEFLWYLDVRSMEEAGVEVDGVEAAKPSTQPITLCAARFVRSRMCLKFDQKS